MKCSYCKSLKSIDGFGGYLHYKSTKECMDSNVERGIFMITIDNFDSSSFDIYDINLVQKEVDGGKKIMDNDYGCLANSKIEVLDINPTQFTMLELAQLLALFPKSLKGSITKPYTKGGIKDKDGYTEYFFLCKRKKACIASFLMQCQRKGDKRQNEI